MISAGFDAHAADPLCHLGLDAEAFATMTRELRGIGAGPVLVLEGGYDLIALRDSIAAVLRRSGGVSAGPGTYARCAASEPDPRRLLSSAMTTRRGSVISCTA